MEPTRYLFGSTCSTVHPRLNYLLLLQLLLVLQACTSSVEAAVDAGSSARSLQAASDNVSPVQTYFLPLPEEDIFQSFDSIDTSTPLSQAAGVSVLTSLAVAVPGTVIWYDHWEDGYEDAVVAPVQSTTEIYGDGDYTNGCVEKVRAAMAGNSAYVCGSGDADLTENEALLFSNTVPLPRDASNIFYDGRDIVYSSFPVAVTKGAYPIDRGSLLAGATEILDSNNYGTEFVAPVGQDTTTTTTGTTLVNAFRLTQFHVMATKDNTEVSINGGAALATLNKGETYIVTGVQQGDFLTTSEPTQVSLITGLPGSTYEMRWYALLPTNRISNDYVTPVSADGSDGTGVWIHNPTTSTISVTQTGINNGVLAVANIGAGDTRHFSTTANQASRFTSNGGDFYALTTTDTSSSGQTGQLYDWGHPLLPVDMLTSRAIVGWGYGCTNNVCGADAGQVEGTVRSKVWVACIEACNLKITYSETETAWLNGIDPLEQIYLPDEGSVTTIDMTGAIIEAYSTIDGAPVKISVSWGQKPGSSGSGDDYGLDLGTVVPPLPSISVSKSVNLYDDKDDNGFPSAGDILEYFIRITNTNVLQLDGQSFTITEDPLPLFDKTNYVPNSSNYVAGGTVTPILDDDTSGGSTAFPLDEGGVPNRAILSPDSFHAVTFQVEIASDLTSISEIVNIGTLDTIDGQELGFSNSLNVYPRVCPTHHVACGRLGNCPNEPDGIASNDEAHEVRCCSDSEISGWTSRCTGMWTESDLLSTPGCYSGTTYFEAKTICEIDNGARLCTLDEVVGDCVYGTGCGYDRQLIWTSTCGPTESPTSTPSTTPSKLPSSQPSASPSSEPSQSPSDMPSLTPSSSPSLVPSSQPSLSPSSTPSSAPSLAPSSSPSSDPSAQPSVAPSAQPSDIPSTDPSTKPSVEHSSEPSGMPSEQPSEQPSSHPSAQPTSSTAPSLPMPPISDCNTICRAMDYTATQHALDIDSFTMPLCTTDCVEVDVFFMNSEGLEWKACSAHVFGVNYNEEGIKTYIPSFACTMYTLMIGETIAVRIETKPSNKCVPHDEVWHGALNEHYSYEHMECPADTEE